MQTAQKYVTKKAYFKKACVTATSFYFDELDRYSVETSFILHRWMGGSRLRSKMTLRQMGKVRLSGVKLMSGDWSI